MPLREARVLAAAALAACTALPCHAQNGGDPASLYQPKLAAQLPPLRVEVIDGIRYRDIETKKIIRL